MFIDFLASELWIKTIYFSEAWTTFEKNPTYGALGKVGGEKCLNTKDVSVFGFAWLHRKTIFFSN